MSYKGNIEIGLDGGHLLNVNIATYERAKIDPMAVESAVILAHFANNVNT